MYSSDGIIVLQQLGDWMLLTHGYSVRIPYTKHATHATVRKLPVALQFLPLLKEGSFSLTRGLSRFQAVSTESLVHHFDQCRRNLKGAHI